MTLKEEKFRELFIQNNMNFDDFNNIGKLEILKRGYDEVERIINFCKSKFINFGADSKVWLKSYEELKSTVGVAHDANLPFQTGGTLYKRTPTEILDIIEICKQYNIDNWENNDTFYGAPATDLIFNHTPKSIMEIINYCVANNINFRDQSVFKYMGVNEIQKGKEICDKLNVDLSCFLGTSRVNSHVIIRHDGVVYTFSNGGKTLLHCSTDNGEVIVPHFVEYISDNCFSGTNVKKVVIPESVHKIGDRVFCDCKELESVIFKGSLLEIPKSTFSGCVKLEQFAWPNNLKKIGESAFRHSAIEFVSELPDTVEEIGNYAFAESFVKKFESSNGVKRIGDHVFDDCYRLKDMIISGSVSYFDPYCKTGYSLENITIGDWSLPFWHSKGHRLGYTNELDFSLNIKSICEEIINKVEKFMEEKNILPKDRTIAIQEFAEKGHFVKFKKKALPYELIEIIAKCDKKNIYSKIFSDLDVDVFDNNINYLVNSLGVAKYEISDLIHSGNNYNLLSCSIRDFFDNYKYLREQNLVSDDVLKKLYFGDAVGDTPEKLLMDYYKKYKELPELFNSLLIEHNDKSRLELRDRLTYISTMHLLDGNFNYMQFEKAKDKLKYSLLENVVNRDKVMFIDSDIYSVLEEKYPEMCGIMYSLKEKMIGIDEQWFYSLLKEIKKGGKDTTFDKFYKSLTVIKHWNEYEETERLTLLKNEIVGRLLYADIALTYRKTDASVKKFGNKRKNQPKSMASLLQFASKSRDELFTRETKISSADSNQRNPEKIYSRINFILTMLAIDPYSFDALRNAPSEQSKSDCLQNVFAAFANESGYLFGKKEIDECLNLIDEDSQKRFLKGFNDYNSFSTQFPEDISTILRNKLLTRNDQKTFSEFISNVICNAKIPKEMESKYLDYVRELAATFISSKSEDELFKFCGAFDLYLRSKSEYDIQSADEGKACAAVEVFDRKSNVSSDARILYSLHNLNRLAHDVVEIDLKSILDQRHRLYKAKANTVYEELTRILTAYNDLFHMGFSYETVLHLAKKDSDEIWASLEEYIEDEDKTKTLTDQIKELSDKRNVNMNTGTFDAMVEFSLAKSKVQLALNNARMFLGDRLSARRRKSLATFNYELDDKSKKVDFEKLRTIKKKLSIIRDTFDEDGTSKLTDEERELIEATAKPKSYFFESKKLFAQEIMNRISKGFSDDFSAMLSASKDEKVKFYANNGYVAEIQNDERGNPVLVCLCEQFNEPFGIHLQDLPKSIEVQLGKCERTRTIAYAKLDRRGLTLRESNFDSIMSGMTSSNNFVGFRDYDDLSNAIKSNYDNYDVPAKRIRAAMARDNSRSELDGMLSEGANNASGANTNIGGNKHQ